MSEQQRPWLPSEDLEYDLAHEVDPAQRAAPEPPAPVVVPTVTADYSGDYGYDLAHDVPGR